MPYSAPGPFLGAQTASAYQISRSLRFRSSASAYLSRTPGTATDNKKWTWSGWLKRGSLGGSAYTPLFDGYSNSSNWTALFFLSDQIIFYNFIAGVDTSVDTVAVLRDPSAWYHIVFVFDSANATAANRGIIYVNGVKQTVNNTYGAITLNEQSFWNQSSSYVNYIGRRTDGGLYADGYLAEVNFIDGQALTPSSFGAFDTNGVWQPKAYTGTYGTNGFFLPFSDNSSGTNLLTGNIGLGKDFSGNGNFWTTNNVSLAGSSYTSYTSGSGTYTVPSGITSINYLVVGGGGGGAGFGGGGGGGGVVAGQLSVTPGQTISYSVGAGGAGNSSDGSNGANSTFGSVTALGGGGGGSSTTNGLAGGSGGGGSRLGTGGAGTTGQGFAGGNGTTNGSTYFNAGGGGGATGVGGNAIAVAGNTQGGGTGGAGYTWINGSVYGGGGGGTGFGANGGSGGSGGGGTGGGDFNGNGTAGTPNTGGGGGGGKNGVSGFSGGAGIVIVSVGGGTTYDSMIDSPTNYADGGNGRGNYAVLNPFLKYSGLGVPTEGNLNTTANNANWRSILSSIAVTSGKWYAEVTIGSASTDMIVGVFNLNDTTTLNELTTVDNRQFARASSGYGWQNNGNKVNNNTGVSYNGGATYTTNNVIGIALDLDSGTTTLTFYKDGVSQGQAFTGLSGNFVFASSAGGSGTYNWNFGQRPFTYTPPSGFSALNTQNLPTPPIANGAQYMAAVTYTGDSNSGTVVSPTTTNSGNNPLPTTFQPDFVWIKNRSNTGGAGFGDHMLYDVVRGVLKNLSSNLTDAEGSVSTGLSAFNTTGFTPGTSTRTNQTGNTYVGWQWKAGGTGVTNTSGSITSTVSANPSAGFSVVTYTGTGANATVGHGLGVAPSMIIIKHRNGADDWAVGHAYVNGGSSPWNYKLHLDLTNAQSADSLVWNNTAPSSSVFSLGTSGLVNTSTGTYVAYCFAPVAGYSAFGAITGNGSADGPFVYLGFRPRWILIKSSSSVTNWWLWDTARNTYNVMTSILYPDLSNAEYSDTTTFLIDATANGFKYRTSNATVNGSGTTYIYAAFAENPFKYSRAR